jgi:hypothetical protein
LTGAVRYGIGNVTVLPSNTDNLFAAELLDEMALTYEQYRIARMRVYVNPGAHMTNDTRLRTQVAARVDCDNMPSVSTPLTLGSILSSANTCVRTLRSDNPILVADWNPNCKHTNSSDQRIFTNNQQWHALHDYGHHEWVGATVAVFTPDFTQFTTNVPKVNVRVRLDFQFRGRITTGSAFELKSIDIPAPPPPHDLTESQAVLKTKLLTGVYVPINFPVSIGNIDTPSVSDADLIDCTFRRAADSMNFRIAAASSPPTGRIYAAVTI